MGYLCLICFQVPVNTAFPCGHAVACRSCLDIWNQRKPKLECLICNRECFDGQVYDLHFSGTSWLHDDQNDDQLKKIEETEKLTELIDQLQLQLKLQLEKQYQPEIKQLRSRKGELETIIQTQAELIKNLDQQLITSKTAIVEKNLIITDQENQFAQLRAENQQLKSQRLNQIIGVLTITLCSCSILAIICPYWVSWYKN